MVARGVRRVARATGVRVPRPYYDAVRPYGTRDTPILGQLLFPKNAGPAIKQTNLGRNAGRIAEKWRKPPEREMEYGGQSCKSGRARAGRHRGIGTGGLAARKKKLRARGMDAARRRLRRERLHGVLAEILFEGAPGPPPEKRARVWGSEKGARKQPPGGAPVPSRAGGWFSTPAPLPQPGPHPPGKGGAGGGKEIRAGPARPAGPAPLPRGWQGGKEAKGMVPPNASTVGSV